MRNEIEKKKKWKIKQTNFYVAHQIYDKRKWNKN